MKESSSYPALSGLFIFFVLFLRASP